MTAAELISRALYLMTVPKCVSCDEPLDYGDLGICPKCSARFEEIKSRNCSKCAKLLSACSCPNSYLASHFLKRLVKVFRYRQTAENLPANALIYSLKHDNRSDVLNRAKAELISAIKNTLTIDDGCIFTNVPRRRAAVLEYGTDHAKALAKALAKEFGCKYRSLLVSKSKRPQKRLKHEERMKNADFALKSTKDLTGKTVIIVDDIVTTGASMGHCAMLIRSLGAKNIIGASLAIAYTDD